MKQTKKAMLEALEKSLGVVTTAAKACGIARVTHYRWMESDQEYKEAVENIDGMTLDFAESQLHKRMMDSDTTAIIFFLKTKGKKRGYIETREVNLNERKTVADLFPDELKDEEDD